MDNPYSVRWRGALSKLTRNRGIKLKSGKKSPHLKKKCTHACPWARLRIVSSYASSTVRCNSRGFAHLIRDLTRLADKQNVTAVYALYLPLCISPRWGTLIGLHLRSPVSYNGLWILIKTIHTYTYHVYFQHLYANRSNDMRKSIAWFTYMYYNLSSGDEGNTRLWLTCQFRATCSDVWGTQSFIVQNAAGFLCGSVA